MDAELVALVRKWVVRANHPQYSQDGMARAALLTCAKDLMTVIRDNNKKTMEAVDDVANVINVAFPKDNT